MPNHEKNFSSPGARLAPSFNPPPIALRIFADAFSPARSADAFALPIPDLRANRSVALGVEAAEQIVAPTKSKSVRNQAAAIKSLYAPVAPFALTLTIGSVATR